VRFRFGIASPRYGLGGGLFGTTNVPVGAASWGKNCTPMGVVVYVRPRGEVHVMVPSGRWISVHPAGPA
jgi:hypothetical protein